MAFLPINIKVENRLEYYEALDKYATSGDLQPFEKMIRTLEENNIKLEQEAIIE